MTIALLSPAPAAADWLLTPFVGVRLGADSTLFNDLEQGTQLKKFVWGASAALLTDGLLGVEVDFSYIPGFFEGDPSIQLTSSSRGVTLSGNGVLAAPLSVSGLGLRPYVTGGLGLIHVSSRPLFVGDVFRIDSTFFGLNVGGGAIGPVTRRSSIRFDLRNFRSIKTDEQAIVVAPGTQLSFWRVTVGLTLHFRP